MADDGIRDDETLRSLLKGEYDDAASYSDDILAPEREKAFDYYLGDVYSRDGEPEKAEDLQGRTSIVSREVADIVHQMLPGIIRVFTSGEEIVRYEPRTENDVEVAEQQTDYVNYLLDADGNCWFTTLYDAVHDALLKKNGTIRWSWDTPTTTEELSFIGLTPVEAEQLRLDPEIEVLEETVNNAPTLSPVSSTDLPAQTGQLALPPTGPPGAAPASDISAPGAAPPMPPGAPPGAAAAPAPSAPPPLPATDVEIDMTVRRTRTRGFLRIEAIPPEELLISRMARDTRTATYVAHRTTPTVSELVQRGYDREETEKHASASLPVMGNVSSRGWSEAQQRNPGLEAGMGSAAPDKSLWYVLHVDHFIRYDSDDDGVAELHHVCTVGNAHDYIYSDDQVPEIPFATGSPVRMPHAVIGMSVSDQIIDLQDLKTNVLRATLDSLAQAIFPPLTVVENAVNMQDVLSTEVGRVIRANAPGMVQPMAEPFIGPQALGVMQYLDEVKASRTGITRASTGLDDKVLQSTTKTAVDNTVERSQERVEMIARTLAETLVKDTFAGVLRCIVRHQDKPRTVRLRGKWVDVDPRFWDTDADVRVNVGLGRGTEAQRLQFLSMVAQKQQEIITATGPGNPLCAPSQFRETLAEMLRLSGFKDASRFFKVITPEDDVRIAQQAKANQKDDPATIIAKAELAKAEMEKQSKQDESQLKFITAQAEDDRERDKAMMEFILKAAEIQAKYGAQVDIAMMKNLVDRERSAFQAMQDAAAQQQQLGMQGQMGQAKLQQQGQLGQQKIQSGENIASLKLQQQARQQAQREAMRPQPLLGGDAA